MNTNDNYKKLTFIHFNDVYNIYDTNTQPNKCPKGANFIEYVNNDILDQESTIVIFSGDFISPSLLSIEFKGWQMVPVFEKLGIAIGCPGNHEFDYRKKINMQVEKSFENSGMINFLQITEQLKFPWVLSNQPSMLDQIQQYYNQCNSELTSSNQSIRTNYIQEYYIQEKNGVKIGYIGLIDEDCIQAMNDDFVKSQLQSEFIKPALLLAEFLKKDKGCDLIVAVTHMSLASDRVLSQLVDSIDIIFAGHNHIRLREVNNASTTFLIKSGLDFQHYSINKVNIQILPRIKENSNRNNEVNRLIIERQPGEVGIFSQTIGVDIDKIKQFDLQTKTASSSSISSMKEIIEEITDAEEVETEEQFKQEKEYVLNKKDKIIEIKTIFRFVDGKKQFDKPSQIFTQLMVFFNSINQEFSEKCQKLIGISQFNFQCEDTEIRSQEMPVGNFFADCIRLNLNADATFINSGAIRVTGEKKNIMFPEEQGLSNQSQESSLRLFNSKIIEDDSDQKEYTKREQQYIKLLENKKLFPINQVLILSLLPFMDELKLLSVKGHIIKKLLQVSISEIPHGRFLQVSGLSFSYTEIQYKNNNEIYKIERNLDEDSISFQNQGKLQDNFYYQITLPKYIVEGGNGYTFFSDIRKDKLQKDIRIVKIQEINETSIIIEFFHFIEQALLLKEKAKIVSEEEIKIQDSPNQVQTPEKRDFGYAILNKCSTQTFVSDNQLSNQFINKIYSEQNNNSIFQRINILQQKGLVDQNYCVNAQIEGRIKKNVITINNQQ